MTMTTKRMRTYRALMHRSAPTPLCVIQENTLAYVWDGLEAALEVDFFVPNSNRILLKLEHLAEFSPTGSLYDRLYSRLFFEAENAGYIQPGITPVIECSVGNAGAAFARTAQLLGYDNSLVLLPSDIYASRKRQVEELRASISYSSPNIGPIGYIRMLESMLRDDWRGKGKLGKDQTRLYPISKIRKVPNAPYRLLVDEVLCQLVAFAEYIPCHTLIDAFVFGVGSGNAVSQIGSALKHRNPHTKVVVCEHEETPFVADIMKGIEPEMGGIWSEPDYPATTIHGVHLKKLSLDLSVIDGVLPVPRHSRDEGWRVVNNVLGLCAGRPTGLALMSALELAQNVENANILTLVFDHEGKYVRQYDYVPISKRDLLHVEKPCMVAV